MRHLRFSRRAAIAGLLSSSMVSTARAASEVTEALEGKTPLNVFAAASLTDAMGHINKLWQAKGHEALRLSFDSSATLAKEILQGAAADLFLSADEKWMDWLADHDQLMAALRYDILGNHLVLVERKKGFKPVELVKGADLTKLLGADGRLAVGDPDSVPAGIYAKQALMQLGLWDGLKDRIAPAQNVRAALLLVETGQAPAGIVYATDVRVSSHLAVAGTFPEDSHDPIVYPGAVLKQAGSPHKASKLLAFLRGKEAQAEFRRLGFSAPPAHPG